jgi:hypothetical protein
VSWSHAVVAAASTSPFTLSQQIYEHPGDLLECTVKFPIANRANASIVIAWLMALRGIVGTFLLGPVNATAPRGVATGTPLVNGAAQTGLALITDGWSNSITGILKAGDWVQVGTGASARLYPVAQDVNSNGSGQATLDLGVRLRSSPADNAAIVTANPVGLFRRAENKFSWSEELALLYGEISFTAREAL